MGKHLIFVAAGGRGRRLWQALPELKKSGLSKSLGIVINDRPLIAYQLDNLIKIPSSQIILSFCDKDSISVFRQYVQEGKIPKFDYLHNLDTYSSENTTIDIIRSSNPHKPWRDSFETIIVTSGDVFFDAQHLIKMLKVYKKHQCSIQTLCDFEEYMVTLEHHFHPIHTDDGELKSIRQDDSLPSKIICHPQFLTRNAFKIYYQTPKHTSKSEFVNEAIRKGEKFRVLKPRQYVNMNFPQDYELLKNYLTKSSD